MRDLKLFKRKMLEASAFALQEGEGLLQLLHQTWQETSPGMTPQHVRTSISASIEQVMTSRRGLLENLGSLGTLNSEYLCLW